MKRTVLFLMGMMTAVIFALPASAELYKYIDNRGIVRYTDNLETVPERYRSQIAIPATATPEKPAVSEKPVAAPPAGIVKAPEPGPSIEAAAAEPEIVTPAPREPSIAVAEPAPYVAEPVTKEIIVAAPVPVEPAVEKEAPPEPRLIITDIEDVREEEPAVVTAAREPAPELSPLPEPEPFVDEPETVAKKAVVTPTPVETAYLVPDTAPDQLDIDIAMLMDKRKTLLDQKESLDKTFLSLLAEKKALEMERSGIRDKNNIQKYNENVMSLNEKIKCFKEEDAALRDEIEYYNALITRAR